MRKIISFLLILTMIFFATSISFAGTVNENDISVTMLTKTKLLICSGEDESVVSIINSNQNVKVEIKNVEEGNVLEGFFLVNKENGEIYSSYTGKTVNIEDCFSSYDSMETGINLAAVTANEEIKLQISYAKLYDLCGDGITIAAVAGAILSMLSVAYPGAGFILADIILSLSSIGLDKIREGIKTRSTEHGLQVRIYKEKTQKHQGGRIVTGYRYTFSGVERY